MSLPNDKSKGKAPMPAEDAEDKPTPKRPKKVYCSQPKKEPVLQPLMRMAGRAPTGLAWYQETSLQERIEGTAI